MNDRRIRKALVHLLRLTDATAAIFHELPLARGEGRADVVCVNGIMAGFEIKSEQDSLRRLTDQCAQYDRAFDESSVVVAHRHLKRVRNHIPGGWGIFVADDHSGEITIRRVRSPKMNRHTDSEVLTRILWKTECLKLLKHQGIRPNPATPILDLWKRLLELPDSVLRTEVREVLKQRKAAAPLFQCDDSRTIEATA
jgi:hypothetical protein